jgi:hypothetical protein
MGSQIKLSSISMMMTMTPARKTQEYMREGRKFSDVAIAKNSKENAQATALARTSEASVGKVVSGSKTRTSETK